MSYKYKDKTPILYFMEMDASMTTMQTFSI